jgi:hypothetical protein
LYTALALGKTRKSVISKYTEMWTASRPQLHVDDYELTDGIGGDGARRLACK